MNEFGILHLKEERYDTAQSGEMQLLVKISPGRISYAIVNEKESRLQVLYDSPISTDIESALNELIAENAYLRSSFSEVKVSIQTSSFTLIPIQYYTRDDLAGYRKLIQAAEDTKTIVNTINTESINCVSALPLQTVEAFNRAFPGARFFSQVESISEGVLKADGTHPSKLLLQFNENSFEVYLSTEDKLLFYNIFNIGNADDFNYFLLNILEQFNVESQSTAVILSGNINPGDANFKRVEKYLKNIEYADSSTITLFSTAFEHLPKHHHFSLISLLLCE